MAEFAKGVNVKAIDGKYGLMINVGVNVEKIMENPINEAGFVNITIKKSKSGNWYAEVNEPKDKE